MNINLREIRKMVTVALIQERVGWPGNDPAGDAGQPADSPAIEEMIDEAEQQMEMSDASDRNIALATVGKAVHELVVPLFKAGLGKDVLSPILTSFGDDLQKALDVHDEAERKKAEEVKAVVASPTLETPGE